MKGLRGQDAIPMQPHESKRNATSIKTEIRNFSFENRFKTSQRGNVTQNVSEVAPGLKPNLTLTEGHRSDVDVTRFAYEQIQNVPN